jgi:Na+-translocating ferredoxin:NAD+ oxidoreductase RnfG subunit/ferredoxin
MKIKKWLNWVIIISLLLAAAIHVARRLAPADDRQKELDSLKLLLPRAKSFSEKNGQPPCYEGYDIDEQGKKQLIGLCFLTTDVAPEVKGYAGPIKLMVGMTPAGTLTGIEIISHHETPSYVWGIQEPWFKTQFKGKSVNDSFLPDKDIDGISRATITVTAITQAVKKSAVRVGRERLGLNVALVEGSPWAQLDYIPLALLSGLLGLVLISFLSKNQNWRSLTLVASIALIGLYHTNPISSVNVVNILTYRLPPFARNLFWYLLMGFALGFCLIWGRVYCGFICPFGAVLELLERLNLFSLKISRELNQKARYIKYIILWLIIVAALVLNNANVADYEAFSTLFSLAGDRLDWALIILAVFGSAVIPRFFCRYLCGIGLSLGLVSKCSWKKLTVKENCRRCASCQAACPYGAIETLPDGEYKINPVECIQCHICLSSCPHGSIGR